MILAQKTQNDGGAYVDADGTRFEVRTARGVSPAVRAEWSVFPDLDAALAAWGLSYDPLPELEDGETNYDAEFWGEDAPAADATPNPES